MSIIFFLNLQCQCSIDRKVVRVRKTVSEGNREFILPPPKVTRKMPTFSKVCTFWHQVILCLLLTVLDEFCIKSIF